MRATPAGRAAVKRRVEAAEKVMFEVMQPVDEQRVVPKMNKRLREEKQHGPQREEASLVAVSMAKYGCCRGCGWSSVGSCDRVCAAV